MADDLITQFHKATKAGAELGLAVTVFAMRQGGNVLKGLPAGNPVGQVAADLTAVGQSLAEAAGGQDNPMFKIPNGMQQAAIDIGFGLMNPSSVMTVMQQSLGMASQLMPGGSGARSTGWGPVGR